MSLLWRLDLWNICASQETLCVTDRAAAVIGRFDRAIPVIGSFDRATPVIGCCDQPL